MPRIGPTELFLILVLLVAGWVIYVRLVRGGKLRRETAKKEALQWIMQGKIPSHAQYNRIHDILAKNRYDEECADILAKLTALRGKG